MENKKQEITDSTIVRLYNEYGGVVDYRTDNASRVIPANSFRDVELRELKELIIRDNKSGAFTKGFLMIKDDKIREILGLDLLSENNLSEDGIKELFKERDLAKLESFLQYASNANLDKLVRVAIEIPVKDLDTANLIQAYSGKNIIEIIRDKADEQVQTTGVRQRVDGKAPENATTPVRGRMAPKN